MGTQSEARGRLITAQTAGLMTAWALENLKGKNVKFAGGQTQNQLSDLRVLVGYGYVTVCDRKIVAILEEVLWKEKSKSKHQYSNRMQNPPNICDVLTKLNSRSYLLLSLVLFSMGILTFSLRC